MDIKKTVTLPKGHYVVAVSGGVDSMVLLDIVRKLPGVTLTVAHFDHGIRADSRADRLLVEWVAKLHKLPFIYASGNLGSDVSEAVARKARYDFLRAVQKQTNATGILTAHHMNDVLETATHNILRGTGRKGMSSLKSVDGIIRPLLHLPKEHIVRYAKDNSVVWREDSTNVNLKYRRNYIRHVILPKLRESSPEKYKKLLMLVKRQAELNKAIDTHIGTFLHLQPKVTTLKRSDVIALPHAVAREVVGEWLRKNGKREFTKKHLERATISIKTGQPQTVIVLDGIYRIELDKKHAHIVKKPALVQ